MLVAVNQKQLEKAAEVGHKGGCEGGGPVAEGLVNGLKIKKKQ